MIAPRGLAFAVAGILLHGLSNKLCDWSYDFVLGERDEHWSNDTIRVDAVQVNSVRDNQLGDSFRAYWNTTAESTGSTATSETTITITASETTGTTAISESAGTTTTSEATGPVSSTVTTSASSTFLTTTAAPTTTTATSAPATTKTIYTRGISPERRDNDAASAAALPHGVEIQEEDYRLTIHIEDEHDVPSIVEESQDKFDHSQPAVLSYSWALTDNQGFGADGVCSVISKADGIVVDTLDFGRGPAYRYRTRSVDVKLPSENPVFSMEFSCAGEGALGVDVLIQEVTLVAAPSNDGELRRA
ncbi:hypothetical protein ACJ41O_002198 [Fusarium nematophilum]